MTSLSGASPSLLERFPELAKAQALLERRRAEYNFNHPVYTTPRTSAITPLEPARSGSSPESLPSRSAGQAHQWPETVKVWPVILLAAILTKHAGALRLYLLARSLDVTGAGHISRKSLFDYLNHLQLDERQRRRWLADALSLGLVVYSERSNAYYLVNLARAAQLAGASSIGYPSTIGAAPLVRHGWRAYVWSAYLASIGEERVISQNKKCELTGIDPRTQRNYQAAIPGKARHNYAVTHFKPAHIAGLQEVRGYTLFRTEQGQVFQRLPDNRIVPIFISRSLPRGRSKKAQRALNCSLQVERANDKVFKLFFESPKQAEQAIRNMGKQDIPPWERPEALYSLDYAGRENNRWRALPCQ